MNKDWRWHWQEDSEIKKCNNKKCDATFNFLLRKHHCRRCGKIFCLRCWGYKLYLGMYQSEKQVCIYCFYNYLDKLAGKDNDKDHLKND